MSRARRSNVNKRPHRHQKVLVMLVEGETEYNYLSFLKYMYNRNITLKIITKSKLSYDINNDLNRFSKSLSVKKSEIVLVYDLENSISEYNKFIKDDKLIHKNSYLVQPCIEAHFLMHYKNARLNNDEVYDAKEVVKLLKKHNPNYKKGLSFSWRKTNVRFKQLEFAKYESIKHFKGYKDNSFSMIGLLIKDHFERFN